MRQAVIRMRTRSAGQVRLKTPLEIRKIWEAGRVVRRVIAEVGTALRPGITTGELESLAVRIVTEAGGSSPCLNYRPDPGHRPYPAWTCVCVNEEVVHAIPGRRRICGGDIVTIDCAVELGGYVADGAWTFPVGSVSPEAERLLRVGREALHRGIAQARPGRCIGDISDAVQSYVERSGLFVVRDYSGHGVGRTMHEEPTVLNHSGGRDAHVPLQSGMTFTIEPMVNLGSSDVFCQDDQWTVVTADGQLSAHFEHTVAVTGHGAEILT